MLSFPTSGCRNKWLGIDKAHTPEATWPRVVLMTGDPSTPPLLALAESDPLELLVNLLCPTSY